MNSLYRILSKTIKHISCVWGLLCGQAVLKSIQTATVGNTWHIITPSPSQTSVWWDGVQWSPPESSRPSHSQSRLRATGVERTLALPSGAPHPHWACWWKKKKAFSLTNGLLGLLKHYPHAFWIRIRNSWFPKCTALIIAGWVEVSFTIWMLYVNKCLNYVLLYQSTFWILKVNSNCLDGVDSFSTTALTLVSGARQILMCSF